jgi:hypothetical protein
MSPAHDFVAGKRVPEVLQAMLDGTAPDGTTETLLDRFRARKERKAHKGADPTPLPIRRPRPTEGQKGAAVSTSNRGDHGPPSAL